MIALLRPVRCLVIAAMACCLLVSVGQANTRTLAKVKGLFVQWDRPDSPGAAVVIVKDGAVVHLRGYGCANLEDRTPITPQTAFDVASVAKQFTGLSIAMLVERGRISLEDDIRTFLPDVPNFGKQITIGQLLHHCSGLRDWTETLNLAGVDAASPIALEMILEMVRHQRELDFAPGEEQQYSNTGYNLLAAAVAKVTREPFRSWTELNIFRPLGMKHTQLNDNPAELIPHRAESYTPAGPGKFERVTSQLAAQGSSSLFTTAEDMAKWLLNFETGRVGGRTAIELTLQPWALNSGAKVNYGFGVALSEYHGARMITHGGSWAGYRSIVMRIPEKRFAVAILSNVGNMPTEKLAREIADLYLNYPAAPRSPQSVPKPDPAFRANPFDWEVFLGTYRLGPGWFLAITREGNEIMIQAGGSPKSRMEPLSERTFLDAAQGAKVEFICDSSNSVTHLLYRDLRVPRLHPPASNPDLLKAYAGDYWSDELRVAYRLEVLNGQLGTRHRSGKWIHLLPTDPDRFDTNEGGWSIAFTRNAAAEVTDLKVSGGRIRNVRFKRCSLPGIAHPLMH